MVVIVVTVVLAMMVMVASWRLERMPSETCVAILTVVLAGMPTR